MGFRLDRTYALKFDGTALEGAEVRFRATPVGVVLRLASELTYADAAELMTQYLIEWNLEDREGNPLPITTEAIQEHMEHAILMRIIREWYKAAKGITAPLEQPSADGEAPQGESLPMETL
jgi:hypothetical protein